MNILFLEGPNLNLLGLKSSKIKEKITIDKLNKHIKKECKKLDIKIKILQTHKEFQALNFLQRNRNWADGLLIIPTSWARNNFNILETINLIDIKTASIYFNNKFSFGTSLKDSIFLNKKIKSFEGKPLDICSKALSYLSS